MSYERHLRLQVLIQSVPILTKIGFRGKTVVRLFSVRFDEHVFSDYGVTHGMEDWRTDEKFGIFASWGRGDAWKKKFILWANSKGSHPVRNKEPSPVVACTENAVTEKCNKEGICRRAGLIWSTPKTCCVFFFLYFADRASQYIYLNINQLDALNFIMSLFHASTCFEHKYSPLGGQNCTIQPLVSSHL